jgi:DNA primase
MVVTDRAHEIRTHLTDAKALCVALGCKLAPRATPRQCTILCPNHAERAPSCSVRVAKDGTIAVKCHACGWSADALGLIAIVEGISEFSDVLKRAAELANAPSLAEPLEAERKPRDEGEGVSDADYHAIWTFLLAELTPFSENAWHVAKYLHERRVFADAEAVGVRGLPKDQGPLVASLLSMFDRSKLEAAGIVRHGLDVIDWPGWPLCIPWRDRFGQITCVQRRRLDDAKPKYRFPPDRAPRAPFGIELLAQALEYHGPSAAEIIITEGAIDCLARRRIARVRNDRAAVIGIPSATTPCVGLPLDLFAGRTIVLALDADDAGEKACAEIHAAAKDVAARFVRARPVGGFKDWAEALAAGGR